jgi:choline dehydrogenase-like flavoprotein
VAAADINARLTGAQLLLDARSTPNGQVFETDVCVVGAGPAGITVARELEGSGARIVLLEAGDFVVMPSRQDPYVGTSEGQPYYPLDACRSRVFGGTTNLWGGWCRPLDAIDFDHRSWLPDSGWPFERSHLDHDYRRAHLLCAMRPCPDVWAPPSGGGAVTAGILDARGPWTDATFHIHPARFGQIHARTLAASRDVRVLAHATATEIRLDRDGVAGTAVRVATEIGNAFTVTAKLFVLAGGGIENTRLLLSSRGDRQHGVGNEYDLVGRFFSDHIHVRTGLVSLPVRTRYYDVHQHGGVTVRGGMSLCAEHRTGHAQLGAGVTLHNPKDPHDVLSLAETSDSYRACRRLIGSLMRGRRPDDWAGTLTAVARHAPEVALLSYRRVIRAKAPTLAVGFRAEQSPNRDSRVTLQQDCDRFGMPRVRLAWKLTDTDRDSLRRANASLFDQFRRQGFQVRQFAETGESGWANSLAGGAHHIGTTRMHRDPKRGVVDEHCRVYSTPNVYIAGSSTFPTGGWAPPTLTIVALAVRLAAHLRERLAAVERTSRLSD